MDTFHACVGFGPLAIYLLALGAVHLSGRPLVVSGAREKAALGLALFGLVAIGPMQLFMPHAAAAQFGPRIWWLLLSFYLLCLTLVVLLSRPRLVVYNVSLEQLRPILQETVHRLDSQSIWADNAVSMPSARVHFFLDVFGPLRNVVLVATGDDQSIGNWRRLQDALRRALPAQPEHRRTVGLWLALCGLLILLAIVLRIADDPQTVARGFDRLLHP